MQTEIHGFNVVYHDAKWEDVLESCNILGIKYELFKEIRFGNATILTYCFAKARESVRIKANEKNGLHYVRLDLKGSFFDNSPNFKMQELLRYLSGFRHTYKQLDVAFVDDMRCLTKKQIKYWCNYSEDCCVGSLIRREAPILLFQKRKLLRIQLESPRSKTSFGTIYRRPDTRFFRIEIKFKDKRKITYLLEKYNRKKIHKFERRSIRALLSCINFVTASSKKKRKASEYVMQPSWRSFLGTELRRIKWRDIYRK